MSDPAVAFANLEKTFKPYHIAGIATVVLATLLLLGHGDWDPDVRRYVIPALALYAVGAGVIGYFQRLAYNRHALAEKRRKQAEAKEETYKDSAVRPSLPRKVIWGIFLPSHLILFLLLVVYCIVRVS